MNCNVTTDGNIVFSTIAASLPPQPVPSTAESHTRLAPSYANTQKRASRLTNLQEQFGSLELLSGFKESFYQGPIQPDSHAKVRQDN